MEVVFVLLTKLFPESEAKFWTSLVYLIVNLGVGLENNKCSQAELMPLLVPHRDMVLRSLTLERADNPFTPGL